ncbi:MAG: glycosyltransferase family 2 protein [Bradyrhizobium sp.]|uniref:glycosyltransferase family 2 protein n=1 Tax=Bradyrhizobium sp. TaxID=376 RepID=UPI0025C20B02|nr:glycosyltransferase family A protein [Bradyrhizobium sp.]MBI5260248.1 glycosyltransferase family 2 protein [Bradyrhizobium sp.]
MSPKISVVIPSYNYGKYLRQCVRSAAEQSCVDHEVVIVENGSTDGSLDIARSLANEYPNVRLVSFTSNAGIVASINRCWSEVRGEYAVLLCADDLLTSGSLARSLAFMELHPNVGLIFGPADEFSGDDAPTETPYAMRGSPPVIHSGEAWITERCRSGINPIFAPEAMFRTEMLRKVGPAPPELPHTFDLYLWLRIASETDVAYLTGPLQALYRRHPSNHSVAYRRNVLMEMQQLWAAFEQFFLTIASHSKRAAWEMLVRKSLAKEIRYCAAREFSLAGGGLASSDYKPLLVFADTLDPAISSRAGREFAWAIRVRVGPRAANLIPTLWVAIFHRLFQRYLWKRRARRMGI